MTTERTLIITNGDSAAELLIEAGFGDNVLPWRDVLHDGPVPASLNIDELSEARARFIASRNWGNYEETINQFYDRNQRIQNAEAYEKISLWFEHDLYDQLQLLQILDHFSGSSALDNIWLIQADDYLGMQTPQSIKRFSKFETLITDVQFDLAKRAWAAFRESSPQASACLLDEDTSALPYLEPIIRRLLQELPDNITGLSRTEKQILDILKKEGPMQVGRLFKKVSDCEEALFMGDWSFWIWLDGLSKATRPAVTGTYTQSFPFDADIEMQKAYISQEATITEFGRRVLNGDSDLIVENGVDRWLGGTHLLPESCWRWDSQLNKLNLTG